MQRRTGDTIAIDGAYQHRALSEGPAIQRFWHHAKLRLLDWAFTVTPGMRILDVGCGSGVFADALARRGCDVTAIDANPEAIAYAARTFGRPGLRFLPGLLDELQLGAESYDAVTCLEVIEHVHLPQVRVLLSDLYRMVVPGGRVLLTTPNYRGLWPIVEWTTDRVALLTGAIARMDGDQHVCRFDRARLRGELLHAGFSIDSLRTYCTVAPFTAAVSWSLADGIESLERRFDLPFGNLLVAVARRPD